MKDLKGLTTGPSLWGSPRGISLVLWGPLGGLTGGPNILNWLAYQGPSEAAKVKQHPQIKLRAGPVATNCPTLYTTPLSAAQ